MKRTRHFAEPVGTVECRLASGTKITVPLVQGLLKHPTTDSLRSLLQRPAALRKYTHEAIRTAPWNVLRAFPRAWLRQCLPQARIRPGRRKALEFMLGPPPGYSRSVIPKCV
ncbi:MAG: hypothetical protein JXR37_05805 [Kiritimatiellae bacterium]|nr:hypothetical protein [Kiritimatiellia bacterium]